MFRRTVGSSTETYFPTYDGNGNTIGLVKAEDAGVTGSAGTVAARYEYGPFGNTLRLSGEPVALDNPFRFSTKFQDDYAELLYYGFRFYNSSTGRWLNRDPISEAGGFNLYGFCRNDPIYYIDAYGRCWKLYFKASFWRAFGEGVKNDLYDTGATTVSGLQQGLLVGSDIIGYSAASAFGYGSSFEGYSDLFQDVVADPTSFDPDDLRANIAFGALKSEGAILM